jgi:hypothetical protein
VATLIQDLIDATSIERRGKHSADSRLSRIFSEIEWYRIQYGSTPDGVAQVRCENCRRPSLFRFLCWAEPYRGITEVFRIPRLLYDETIPQGVGFIITNGVTIGEMSYGTLACRCHRLKIIEIR